MKLGRPFGFTNSTDPGFNTALASSGLVVLESTSINRRWQGPSNRAIRVAAIASDDFYINVGTSLITCGTTNGVLILGGTVESFYLQPKDAYVCWKSSTDVSFNITIGYGG